MEHFILRANAIHNGKYDYSQIDYVNAKTRITIICSDHGEFKQTPDNHLNSGGCKECSKKIQGLSRRLTHEQFLKKAADVHGDTYDYSYAQYVKWDIPITIICLVHGSFPQTPNAHLSGKGCKKCGIKTRSDKQRKTFEEFLKEAHSKHGGVFDYSGMVYVNTHTQIKIRCTLHGVFEQTPIDHLSSMFGCKQCADIKRGLSYRSNTDEFIEKAIHIHGATYDYIDVKYEKNNMNVIIICKIHGQFEQLPAVHLRGGGCSRCNFKKQADVKRYTNTEFIEKAQEIHGLLYIYDRVEYVTSHIHVIIGCTKHGEFVQTPNSHLSGSGCPECADEIRGSALRKTLEQFIQDSREIHGDTYGYAKVVYIDSTTPVIITCPTHGDFEQTPGGHLCGGCKKCANEYIGQSRRKSLETFIKEVSLTHNNKYMYDKVVYVNSTTDIIIICPTHGEFTQKPVNHWCGQGCAKCSRRISKISLEWLRLIMVNHPKLIFEYRIPSTRFDADAYDPETNTIYEFHGDYWHGNPTIYSSNIYNSSTKCTMGDLYRKTQEKKRRCIELGYKYVEIWERDWIRFKKIIRATQLRFRK